MMKQWMRFLLVYSVMTASTGYAAQQPDQAATLDAANPVAPATPSEQAVDMQSFQYESKHDVETVPANTPPAQPASDKPLPDSVIREDVMKRFSKVYQEKKNLYDKAQIDLTAAKNDLGECDKLSATEKEKCVTVANEHIETIRQKLSNLDYDMNILKREMQDIAPTQ